MADASFRATARAQDFTFGSSTATCAKPTGTVDNDGMIAVVTCLAIAPASPATVTGPAGWTQIGSDETDAISGGAVNARFTFWRKLAASEGADYSWTLSGANGWVVTIFAYDGVRTSGSFVQAKSAIATGTGTSPAATALTLDQTRAKLLFIAGSDAGSVTFTAPSGLTEQVDTNGVTLADLQFGLPIDTGARTGTASASGRWQAWLIAIYSEDSGAANYSTVNTTASGADVIIIDPTTRAGRAVVIHHAYTTDEQWIYSVPLSPLVTRLTNIGYAVAISSQSGDTWGNQTGLDDNEALVDLLVSTYGVTGVVSLAVSAGGFCAMNEADRTVVTEVKGVIGLNAAMDLAAIYAADPVAGVADSIDVAYPSGFVGFDPIDEAASDYAGKRFLLYASTDDTVVPKTTHSDAFATLVAGQAKEATVVACTGAHELLCLDQIDLDVITNFLNRCFRASALTSLGVG